MSNGRGWRHYQIRNLKDLEDYLLLKRSSPNHITVSLKTLLDGKDTNAAPRPEWYALHRIVAGSAKWSRFDIIAWGLNVTYNDLRRVQVALMPLWTRLDDQGRQMYLTRETSDIEAEYILEDVFRCFDEHYATLRPRFSSVQVPVYWKRLATRAFIKGCRFAVNKLIRDGYFAQYTGALTKRGRAKWPLPDGGRLSQCVVRLPYDCLSSVFAQAGLRPNTMRAIARGVNFDRQEQDSLLRERHNPLSLLGQLVDEPSKLLSVMHRCDVILSGSRAAAYFWPQATSPHSDCDFYAHPTVEHWMLFCMYLSSIGVAWHFPNTIKASPTPSPEGSQGPAYAHCLSGTIRRGGQEHRVQLMAHMPHIKSSVQAILRFHSSIVQCFISGFAAVSMYAPLTTSGRSRVWQIGEGWYSPDNAKAQSAVNKYVNRGVQFVVPELLEPAKIPEPKGRHLFDGGTMCISFAEYVPDEWRLFVEDDFDRLRKVRWWESSDRLVDVRPDRHRREYWEWDDFTTRQHASELPLSPAWSMNHVLTCSMCDVREKSFCYAPSDHEGAVWLELARCFDAEISGGWVAAANFPYL